MSTSAQMQALVSLLTTEAGIDEVITGLPDSLDTQTVAYLLAGPRRLTDSRSGIVDREVDFYVYLGYRVDGREKEAEENLADVVDAVEMAWLLARKQEGPFLHSTISETMAGGPDYRDFNAQEYRWWPLSITMRETFTRP